MGSTLVQQRVHRILRRLKGYRSPGTVHVSGDVLRGGEHVLGAYRASAHGPSLAVTDLGLRWETASGWNLLPYAEIARVSTPAKSPPANELTIISRRGHEVTFPMHTEGRTSDAFEFQRFVDRVLTDLDKPTVLEWTHPSVRPWVPASVDPVRFITAAARDLAFSAFEKGWEGPPFDPLALARLQGIAVTAASDVLDARLVSAGSGVRIEYNPNRPPARIRYSIAHEIAHTLFPDAASATRHRGLAADEWQLELLCNVAAAELLMPSGSLAQALEPLELGVDAMLTLRERFLVSLEAVAIRLARTSPGRVAAFAASRVESGGKAKYHLEYVLPSPSWIVGRANGLQLPADSVVGQTTAVGFTQKSAQSERWNRAMSRVHVEAVGAPPYPGGLLPRVVGLVWPWSERPVREGGPRFLLGTALEPTGTGPKLLVHIVNDTATSWGGGSFAANLQKRWPDVQKSFRAWAAETGGPQLGAVHLAQAGPDLWVASMVAQHRYRQLVRPGIRYEALANALDQVAEHALKLRASVHMPRIGTGNARGNWSVISGLIEEALLARSIEVTVYDLPSTDPTRASSARPR